MCGTKGYGFSAVLVINRVSILADFGHFGHKLGMVLCSSLDMGMFLRRSHFFIIMEKKINKSTRGSIYWIKRYPLPLTAHHARTTKLLLCSFLEENNSMRDLRELNHRNLRLFDTQHHIISHQHSGLFIRTARVWRTYVCGTGAYVVRTQSIN